VNLDAGPPIAWEDESVPFPANLGITWWECLISPDRFFSRVSWDRPFARPLLYFLLVGILSGLLRLFWSPWSPAGAADVLGVPAQLQLVAFFLTPFVLLILLALVSLGQHLFAALLAPRRRGIRATATVLCYASGVGIAVAVLPPAFGPGGGSVPGLLGATYLVMYVSVAVAAQVWYVVVNVIGLKRAHSTTTGRAAAIVLLPMAIGLAFATILVIVAVALSALAELPV